MLSRLDRMRNGNKGFNPLALGFVSDLYFKNSASEVQNIFYKKNGTAGSLDIYVPLKDNKFAGYHFVRDAGGVPINTLNDVGSITPVASLLLTRNYDSRTGTTWASSAPNYYALTTDCTITYTVTNANKITFYSLCDNRGGLWEFFVNGVSTKNISVYDVATVYKEQTLIETINRNETYIITGYFRGQDPEHPVATPRGWVYYGNNSTTGCFKSYKIEDTFTRETYIMPVSNVEFAPQFRRYGATYAMQRFPYHGVVTTEILSTVAYVDGVAITDYTAGLMTACKEIKIITEFNAFNTNEPEIKCLKVKLTQTINKYGYLPDFSFNFIVKTEISGYAYMLPEHRAFGTSLVTDQGDTYDLTKRDYVAIPIANQDDIKSMKVVSTINTGYELTSAFVDKNALRIGASDRGSDIGNIMWIESRNDDTINKIYLTTFRSSIFEAGQVFSAKNIYYIGRT